MEERFDRVMYVRDECLTGDAYKANVSMMFMFITVE